MKPLLAMAFLIVLALPFLWLIEEINEPAKQKDPTETNATDGDSGKPNSAAKTPNSGTTSEMATPTGTSNEQTHVERIPAPPAVGQSKVQYHGYYYTTHKTAARSAVLEILFSGGSRKIRTSKKGEFRFSIAAKERPFQVRTGDGSDLYRSGIRPPKGKNVQLHFFQLPPRGDSSLIALRAVSVQKEDDNYRLRVFGSTLLQPDTALISRLLGGQSVIQQESLSYVTPRSAFSHPSAAKAAEFVQLADLRFTAPGYYSGWYQIQLAWRPYSATPAELQALGDNLPDPMPGELPENLLSSIYLGDPDREAAEEKEILAFYGPAVREAAHSYDLLRLIGVEVRGKRLRWSEKKKRFARSHAAMGKVGALVSGDKFQIERWRKLIDKELPLAWKPHRDLEKIPYPQKYPRRKKDLKAVFNALNKLSHLESQRIYEHLGMSRSRLDFVAYEFPLEMEHKLAKERVSSLLKKLRRAVR